MVKTLKSYANKKGLFFGVSPFDLQSLKKLKQINVDLLKLPQLRYKFNPHRKSYRNKTINTFYWCC